MTKNEEGDAAVERPAVTELNPWPAYIQVGYWIPSSVVAFTKEFNLFCAQDRLQIWDKLKAEYEEELAKKPSEPITVKLPDGKTVDAKSWQSTPYDIAKGIRYATRTILSHECYQCFT